MHAQDASLYFRRSTLLPHVEWRRADQSSACYHTHTHDEFSVGVIDAGNATYRNRQHKKIIRQGATVLINPAEAHSCNPDSGRPWSYRMLFIDAHWVNRLSSLTNSSTPLFAKTSVNSPVAYQQFSHVFEALEQNENPLAVDEKLISLLMGHFLNRCDLARHQLEPQGNLNRAKELILDQLTENITLTSIAQVSGLSPYHLIRLFKQVYGQTPHAFQLDQRINRAKQLLKSGHSIAQVAQQLGFSDQSHFQRNFKKRHAVIPSIYQRLTAQ